MFSGPINHAAYDWLVSGVQRTGILAMTDIPPMLRSSIYISFRCTKLFEILHTLGILLSLRAMDDLDRSVMDLRKLISESPVNAAIAGSSVLVALTLAWLIHDFNAWVAFGTGGTPPNLQGYLKITKFRILRALSGDSLRDASKLPTNGLSYLGRPLPRRQGPSPYILSRTLPQRQSPAPLDKDIYDRLHGLPAMYAKKYPELLILDKSVTEGRSTDAIYARPELPGRKKATQDPVLGDEIAHVHPAENSLHVWLTLTDTRKVVEAGWGERFPLASLQMVDGGWTFLYAPRTMEEVDVVSEIMRAGIGHLTGQRVAA